MLHGIVPDALIFLAIAVVIAPLSHRLRLTPVLGYLLAGSLVGPAGLGIVEDNDGTQALAELGIVFLLFMIGLELSWDRLRIIRHFIFGLGTAQVFLTALLAGTAFALTEVSAQGAMVLGLAVAFSSTAFVLQILSERGELSTQTGRVAVAVLILQDLAVVPLLVMIPLLGHKDASLGMALLETIAKTCLAMAVIFIVGRLALRFLFRAVAATRSPESFFAAAAFAAIGTSYLTEAVGLSASLGAFLAGIMLASTEYRHQVEADLQPARGLLMGLFFLTVGMTLDARWLSDNLAVVSLGVGMLLCLKTLVITGLAMAFRFPLTNAIHLGLLLAQGGEFAFVVLGRATHADLVPQAFADGLTAVIAVSMMITPGLAALGDRIARLRRRNDDAVLAPRAESADLTDHVILAGYGRVGQVIANILKEHDIPFVAIDRDPQFVERLRAQGEPVFFGDIRKLDVLHAVGAARAKAVVLTIDSGSSREKLVPRLHQRFPDLRILVRARDRRQAGALAAAGASVVVPEILEGSLQLAGHLLRSLGSPQNQVVDILEEYRRNDYARLALTTDRE